MATAPTFSTSVSTKVARDCASLSSGTIAGLIGSNLYIHIDAFAADMFAFACKHPEFKTWQEVYHAMQAANLVPDYAPSSDGAEPVPPRSRVTLHYAYRQMLTVHRWPVGESGDKYLPCGDCGTPDAMLKGYLIGDTPYIHVATLDKGPGESMPAVFCETCFDKRATENPVEGLCPVCGERVALTGCTTDGRLTGSCRDAFTEEQWFELVPLGTKPSSRI